MKKSNFTVIKGGLELPPGIDSRRFVSAYATDTRLMGALCMYIKWEIERYGVSEDYHQFFYFDSEEYGFENFISIYGNDYDAIRAAEISLMCGLGGQKTELSLRECMCLFSKFADMNTRKNLPFPGDFLEYSFLILPPDEFSEAEHRNVMSKVCTELKNYYQLVHYFIMRIFGKDFDAASYLVNETALQNGDVKLDIYSDTVMSTLHRNVIDIDFTESQNAFMCESLIENQNSYMIAISEVFCNDNMEITGFKRINLFNVSNFEAAMQLAKSEYITVYDLLIKPSDFEICAGTLLEHATVSEYEYGKLYMMFHKNNNHVQKRTFMLNDDVEGVIYVGDCGQMILAAYDLASITKLEARIFQSNLHNCSLPNSKYELKESVIYDFINSGMIDFNQFIALLNDDDDGE